MRQRTQRGDMPGQIGKFKFRNTDQIGAAGAEEDEFLKTCFVDTGNIGIRMDDGRSIVESDITQDASVIVSPPYRRALGIVEKHAAP